ncbi:hypothetical protein G4Y79_15910 [Phototrophicus methaneseepsis]|uniref:Uncharacterized protein n=1 Tax=Phototrophicus methaneseepsis TaxID=2710758 RepID=A0A7S8E6D0_9CHLR|nr:hypothetical protein [Phototrophicus methaneseepsis]QPC81187.1 hypothetical protein G4Y79_15910 [Phototrophicus methaneseepsis]
MAEWNSILATSQQSTLPLIISGLLRLHLFIMTVIAAFYAMKSRISFRVAGLLVASLLILSQLPPVNGIANIFNDNNNAQQFGLAILSLICTVGIITKPQWPWVIFIIGLVIGGIISTIGGVWGSLDALNTLNISAALSIGAAGILILYILFLVLVFITRSQQTERG